MEFSKTQKYIPLVKKITVKDIEEKVYRLYRKSTTWPWHHQWQHLLFCKRSKLFPNETQFNFVRITQWKKNKYTQKEKRYLPNFSCIKKSSFSRIILEIGTNRPCFGWQENNCLPPQFPSIPPYGNGLSCVWKTK